MGMNDIKHLKWQGQGLANMISHINLWVIHKRPLRQKGKYSNLIHLLICQVSGNSVGWNSVYK